MTKRNKVIIAIAILILIVGLSIFFFFLYKNNQKEKIIPTATEIKTTELNAIDIVSISKIERYASKESENPNESVYLVKDGAMLTLRDSSVSKKDGESENLNDSKNIGLNSAIVVTYNSSAKISNSNISTEISGANAIYSTGQKAKTTIEDTTIETLETASSTLVASNNGEIEGTNLTIRTKSKSSPAVEITSNNGKITLKDSLIETSGAGSPIFYARGKITIQNTTGTANGSRIAILENKADVTLEKVTAIASGGSNESSQKEAGILIHGNDKEETAILTATDSSLNINQSLPYYKSAPLFLIDTITTTINLSNTPLNFGSNIFMEIKNSNVTLNVTNQKVEGDINIDETSFLTINLKNNTIWNSPLPDNSKLTLDKSSTLTLKKDTYLKEFQNESTNNTNIQFNGYKLYVNGENVERN